jgi:hypothetical protein
VPCAVWLRATSYESCSFITWCLVTGEVRKGPLPPLGCDGQSPPHYKYSAGGALPGPS